MTLARAALVVIVLSGGAAGLLALASRAPEQVRSVPAESGDTDPDLGAAFSDREVARHGAYRGPAYLGFALTFLVEIAILIVLTKGPIQKVADLIEGWPGGWIVRTLVLAAFVAVVLWAASLPLGYVRTLGIDRAWGLSTQDIGSWSVDRLRSLGVSVVVGILAALAFFAVVRWQPRTWWLIGAAVFSVLTALMTFLWPVVIAPLFNRFTPLEASPLRDRVVGLAREAGVTIDDVLVADASRRTTAENAYVAGLAGTKRMVLFDNLIEAGSEDETAFVVAHELGHEVEAHVLKGVAISAVGLLAGFALLAWLAARPSVLSWAGVSGPADARALPALILFSVVAGLLVLPVQNTVSRAFERRADRIALELTEDPETAVQTFRRLAFSNLADLRPPAVAVWTLYTHPPIPERIRSALSSTSP